MSIGHGFGAALTHDGQVYSWGENNLGQLGAGDNITKATPQLNQNLEAKRVTHIACGQNFTIALGQTLLMDKVLFQKQLHEEEAHL